MGVNNRNIKLDIINDARIILLGIAAFIVVFFHTYNLDYMELINVPVLSHIVNFIQRTGNCGVDIFLFLSGIGLYLSMSKNNILKFYKNRFVKIIPKYLIVLLVYSFFVVEMRGIKIIEAIIGLPFFREGVRDGWYIAFIMFMYLIFPLIYKLFKKYDIYALFISLFIVVALNLTMSMVFPTDYFKWEIAITRLPVFLIGTFFGKLIYEGCNISLKTIKLSMVIYVLVLLVLYFNVDLVNLGIFTRYLYCPFAISFVINISWLYSLMKMKDKWWLKPIKFMGNHSLEMYLFSEKCTYILRNVYSFNSYIDIYLLSFIITLLGSFMLKKIIDFVLLGMNKLLKNRDYFKVS